MCELLGLSFEQPISADFSIREFALRDVENADGWGLAWYVDGSLALVKEPLKWRESRYARFLENYDGLRSHLFIAHVRHATVGGDPKHADTHPFLRELWGRQYCFAHNGTVRTAFDALPLGRYHPIGNTDSEHIFCHLLDAVAARAGHLESENDWRWLPGRLRSINEMGKLNILMSDGVRLFAYHDAAGFKGLHRRQVGLREHGSRHLEDPTVGIDLHAEPRTAGTIVATRPLSAQRWHSFRPGELLVVEAGRVRFTTARTAARVRG
jgi:predicted glutamine amidotransferase